jgi:hypothetical protein
MQGAETAMLQSAGSAHQALQCKQLKCDSCCVWLLQMRNNNTETTAVMLCLLLLLLLLQGVAPFAPTHLTPAPPPAAASQGGHQLQPQLPRQLPPWLHLLLLQPPLLLPP